MKIDSPPLRILALDGGGLRAAFSLSILQRLEGEVKRPLHEVFDFIIGTSAGGILAFAIGLQEFSADECLERYRGIGEKVFPTNSLRRFYGWTRDLIKGAYWDADVLETELRDIFGETSILSEIGRSKPLIACVASECTQSPGTVMVFSTYSRENLRFSGANNVKVWEALRATTAAPTFFDVAHLKRPVHTGSSRETLLLLDGGLIANNPSLVGLIEASSIFPDHSYVVVSIGTGTAKAKSDVRSQWWRASLRVTLSTAMSSEVVDAALECFPAATYLRINGDITQSGEMDCFEYFEHWRREGQKVATQYTRWSDIVRLLSG
jgi:patatin-like phospholipase/acyl hydrolase